MLKKDLFFLFFLFIFSKKIPKKIKSFDEERAVEDNQTIYFVWPYTAACILIYVILYENNKNNLFTGHAISI